ncbi:tetratricopeptide repeat protein [Coraliomargarita parva]|uniref:tetratricopeptide repeat protein n=1 Tax=Coraliomargarita parva TaxID=3014050 RepID=UPI0022B35B55|nr:tetratricopeptide repeat protein [Coraliomargarita parva]
MKRVLTLLLGASLAAGSLTAQVNQTVARQMWNDSTFVNEFLGSYGFLAGYEPGISEDEKQALRALIDLIKVSPSAAIQQLEPQIKTSSSAAFDFILGNLYFQDGQLGKATRYYNSAIKKHPDFRRAYKNLGLVYVQEGDFDKAIPTISKAMELGEVDGRSYGLLGYGYLTKGRYYPAEAAYRQAILMQPSVKDWKVGLARCLLETSRYDDAIALFDTLIKDEPDNADYWLLQGNAYIGKGASMMAAKNLEIVRRMNKADLGTLTLLGDIYMNNESPDLALDAYLAGIKQAGPGESKALLRAAELLSRTGNYAQAKTMIASLRQKLGNELDKDEALKLLTVEAKIARAEGDDDTAVAKLNQIVERDALNGEAIIELANYYADQDDIAKAVNRYEQAAKIDGFERPALVAHAQALVRDGQYKEALPLLRRALKIESDNNLEDYAQRVERAAKGQS